MEKVEDLIAFNEKHAEFELPEGIFFHRTARFDLIMTRLSKPGTSERSRGAFGKPSPV